MNFFNHRFFAGIAPILGLLGALSGGCAGSAPGTIGAALGQQADRRLFVRSMPVGEGAERAGLLVDDEILTIDGKDVHLMTQDEVRGAVRGDVGSAIVVTVRRGGERLELKVIRTPLLAPKK